MEFVIVSDHTIWVPSFSVTMMSSVEATKDVMRVFDNRKEMKAETPMCQGGLRMVFSQFTIGNGERPEPAL